MQTDTTPGETCAGSEAGTIHALLAARAARDGLRELLRDGQESVTYADLQADAEADAGRLAALGVGAGDRVVLWLPNGRRWASLFFACARLGAVAVTAGTRLRTIDLRHLLTDSAARVLAYVPDAFGTDYERMVASLLAEQARHGTLPMLARAVSIRGPGTRAGLPLDAIEPAPAPVPLSDAAAPAVVCYTSGTTGRPKGCVHAHSSLVRNGTSAVGLSELGHDDRILCPVPFAHVFGFHMGLLQATIAGATLVNAEPYRAETLLDMAESERATVLYLVPAMAREVVRAQEREPRDLSALRLVLLAGSPVSAELRRRVADPRGLGASVSVVYGCTEAPTLTQLVPGDPPEQRASSVGRATPGVDIRVVRADGGDADPGEVGEVLARGYNTMIGYLGDPEATAARYRDGWLVTGDLGWLDAKGFLHVAGRSSDVFDVGGFNAYPREIEAQIEELDGVVEVAVVGVPDARLGHVPMAWVTTASRALGEQDVLDWARAHMASYKRPRHVRIVESLPRTATGKLSRVKLEQLARRALPQLDWEGHRA